MPFGSAPFGSVPFGGREAVTTAASGAISGSASAVFSAAGTATNATPVIEETGTNKGRKSRLKFWRDLYVEKLAEAEREEKRQLAELAKEQAIIERQKKQQAERERARLAAIEAERFRIETAQAERRAAVLAEALGEIERRNEQARLADEIAALNAQITATQLALVELGERRRQWEHHQRLLEEDFIMLMAA